MSFKSDVTRFQHDLTNSTLQLDHVLKRITPRVRRARAGSVSVSYTRRKQKKPADAKPCVELAKGYPEFDPDQTRGADGQWTSGGGSGGSSSGNTPTPGDFTGPNAGNKWRAAAGAAIGFSVVATGVGTYLMLRRGMAPQRVVVAPVTTASGNTLLFAAEAEAGASASIVRQAINSIPKAHADALRANGVSFFAVKNMGNVEAAQFRAGIPPNSATVGFYNPANKAVVVPSSIMVGGKSVGIKPEFMNKVTLHEAAHALDSKGYGVGHLSRDLQPIMFAEFNAFANADPVRKAAMKAYYDKSYKGSSDLIRNELFADIYAAKYIPATSQLSMFFGQAASRADLHAAFPRSMKFMDSMDVSSPAGGLLFSVERQMIEWARKNPNSSDAMLRQYLASTKRASVTKGYPEYNADQARGSDGQWTEGGGAPDGKPSGSSSARRAAAMAALAAAVFAGAKYSPAGRNFSNLYRGIRTMDNLSARSPIGGLARLAGAKGPSALQLAITLSLVGGRREVAMLRAMGASSAQIAAIRSKYRDLYHGLRATGGSRLSSVVGATRRGTLNRTPFENAILRAIGKPTGSVARTRDMMAAVRRVGSSKPLTEALGRQAGLSRSTLRSLGAVPRQSPGLSIDSENKMLRRLGWALRRAGLD